MKNKSRIILGNGPIKVGKDEAILHLIRKGFDLKKRECKDKLHELTMMMFNVKPEVYWSIYNNRETKEVPMEMFKISQKQFFVLGANHIPGILLRDNTEWLSVREAMIYVSEVVCKPAFGKDYFGQVRADNVDEYGGLYFDGSTGFTEELPPLIEKVGQENILLLRIYRPGYEYSTNDSRGYIPDGVLHNTIDVHNTGTFDEYLDDVYAKSRRFLSYE